MDKHMDKFHETLWILMKPYEALEPMAGTGAPGGHGPTVDSKAQFLASVEEMAMNALATVAAYNAEIKDVRLKLWNYSNYMELYGT